MYDGGRDVSAPSTGHGGGGSWDTPPKAVDKAASTPQGCSLIPWEGNSCESQAIGGLGNKTRDLAGGVGNWVNEYKAQIIVVVVIAGSLAVCNAASEACAALILAAVEGGGTICAENEQSCQELLTGGGETTASIEGGLQVSSKIAGQVPTRGWTPGLINDTFANPVATHSVWDLTGGTQQAATAYVRADGSYIVVNDATKAIVQVSDATDAAWNPVWMDPRFQR
jgi:hypothetical protein